VRAIDSDGLAQPGAGASAISNAAVRAAAVRRMVPPRLESKVAAIKDSISRY
jgi:hypothetical protein